MSTYMLAISLIYPLGIRRRRLVDISVDIAIGSREKDVKYEKFTDRQGKTFTDRKGRLTDGQKDDMRSKILT